VESSNRSAPGVGLTTLRCPRGETDHYDWVCQGATYGIARTQLDTGIPCTFGVLTVEDMDQALARSGGDKRDSGYNAALATVHMARLLQAVRAG